MTDQEINIAIAEACGTLACPACAWGADCTFHDHKIPAYTTDLNAMAEAVSGLTSNERRDFQRILYDIVCGTAAPESDDWFYVVNAPAAQRAEAFLKTLGLWKE